MTGDRRPAHTRRRGLVFAASVIVHAVLLVIFAQYLRPSPYLSETPIMNVDLAPRPHVEARTVPRVRRGRRAPVAGAHSPIARIPPTQQQEAVPPAPEAREAGVAPQPRVSGPGVALRGALGCEHAAFLGLSADERQHCRDQLAAGRPDATEFKLNLDPGGQYVTDPEPYLNRRPKNGCKVRAAGDRTHYGQEGAAAGITCVRPF